MALVSRGGAVNMKPIVVGCLIATVIAIGTVAWNGISAANGEARPLAASTAALVVDSVPVPIRELRLFLEQERSQTIAHFPSSFGTQTGPAFWSTSYGGETPAHYLRSAARDDAVRVTVELQLAYRQGLVPSAGYDQVVKLWHAENARRAAAIAAGKPIYGPRHYSEANYFTYLLDDLTYALPAKLVANGTMKASDATLRSFYAAHRSEFSAVTVGPVVDDYARLKTQVRIAYLQAQLTRILDDETKAATVVEKPAWSRVNASCLDSGTC